MSLVRHLAGIPTATEQRCIRCCEVILSLDQNGRQCLFPGQGTHTGGLVEMGGDCVDCTPHDPHAIDDLREVLGEALAEMERAR